MSPDDISRLTAPKLGALFCKALETKDIELAQDCILYIESRFLREGASITGSRQFVEDFLPVAGWKQVRALRQNDPLVRSVAQLEYLLELAGDHARTVSEEDILRQVVDSRERGRDVIEALADAPGAGYSTKDLAAKLGTSAPNLSPILSLLHAHGVLDRTKQGKHVFNTLTPRGRSLLTPAQAEETAYMFCGPINLAMAS